MGTLGFHFLEGGNYFDAFYMSLITITTIGYGETHELSAAGRLFNSLIIVMGVGTFTYTVTQFMHMLVQQELLTFFRSRAVEKQARKMQNHFIVYGAGRLGSRIATHLRDAGTDFVVVDENEQVVQRLIAEGVVAVQGDATEDFVLRSVNVDAAKGLVTAIGNDPTNVYICLVARDLNPALYIVSRASSQAVENRLRRAGANRVISPERIGSRQIADALLRPMVIDFFDEVMESTEVRVNLEDVEIGKHSKLDGISLSAARLPDIGVNVILIRHKDGSTQYRPSRETEIEAGDHLVVVGDQDALKELMGRARPGSR